MPRRLLITAGPTHEPIDAVRYLGNRSSGRLGIELAAAGSAAGWQVTLLLGPTPLEPPAGVDGIRFASTADLAAELEARFPLCDVLIMAAAVADYRPRAANVVKLPRGDAPLTLALEPTPDLVASCAARRRPDQRIIGFALEASEHLEPRAREKLRRKGLTAIVANPLDTMDAPDIRAVVLTACGERLIPPDAPLPKADFARWLITWLEAPSAGV